MPWKITLPFKCQLFLMKFAIFRPLQNEIFHEKIYTHNMALEGLTLRCFNL